MRNNSAARLRSLTVALALAAAGTLAACSSDSGASANGDSTLNVGILAAPISLNPAKAEVTVSSIMLSLAGSSLIHQAPDGSLKPGLAESWGYVGEGNTTFEFTLRKDLKFSDGTTLDAEAAKTWFEYFAGAGGSAAAALGELKSIQAVDDRTVRLTLVKPNPVIPVVLTERYHWGQIASPEAVANPDVLSTDTFGAGQYKLDPESTVSGDVYTYIANEHYHEQEDIAFDKVVFRIVSEPNAMLQASRSGDLDVAVGDFTTVESAASSDVNVVTASNNVLSLAFLGIDGSVNEALGETKVRQALNHAIDRETIAAALFGDYAAPTSSLFTTDGNVPELENAYPYDPDRAKALLAEAGYPNGFELTIMSTGFQGTLGAPVAQAVAKNLQDVGLDVTVKTAANTTEYFQQGLQGGDIPLIQYPTGGQAMWSFYSQQFAAGSLYNPTDYVNPDMADLWAQGAIASEEEQPEIWQEMTRLASAEVLQLPILRFDSLWYVSDRVRGFELSDEAWNPIPSDWSLNE